MIDPPFSSPLEDTVVVVGMGLIGGSIAAALKHRNAARTVIGVGRNAARIEAARAAGLIDEATTDISMIIDRADLIVVCTPVDQIAADIRLAESTLARSSKRAGFVSRSREPLFTDAGSGGRRQSVRISQTSLVLLAHTRLRDRIDKDSKRRTRICSRIGCVF